MFVFSKSNSTMMRTSILLQMANCQAGVELLVSTSSLLDEVDSLKFVSSYDRKFKVSKKTYINHRFFFFLSELMSTAILNKIIPEDFVNNSYIYPRQKYIIHNHNSLTNIIQAGLTDNTLHLKI